MAMNVLIVDDSAAMRSIIAKTLNLSGLEIERVYQAGNGAEALDMLEENWVDLALVDINPEGRVKAFAGPACTMRPRTTRIESSATSFTRFCRRFHKQRREIAWDWRNG